jgi:3-oxoacyl-(acyl-carrier-protein) synthase
MKDIYIVDYIVHDSLGRDIATNYANMPNTRGAEAVRRYDSTECPHVKCTKAFHMDYVNNDYTTYNLVTDLVNEMIEKYKESIPKDTVVLYGSFVIGSESTKLEFNQAFLEGQSRFSPTKLFTSNHDLLSALVAGKLKTEGMNGTVQGSCSTSMYNLHYASTMIRNGEASAAIIGAADMPALARMQYYWQCTSAISNKDGGQCMPFDNDRDGFLQGEGGTIWFICNKETVDKYNLKPKAKLHAITIGAKVASMTAHDKTCENQISVINRAFKMAGMLPSDMAFFNAHATSTDVGDDIEFDVFQRVFDGVDIPIVSFKGYIGHTMSACGLVETAYGLEATRKGMLHPNYNLKNPLSEDSRLITEAVELKSNIHMKASFGFGGRTAVAIIESL